MASKDSFSYFQNLKDMSYVRATAETLVNNKKVRLVTVCEAYELAKKQAGVSETDLLIYPEFAKQIGLPVGAKVLNDCHGKIVARTAKARKFYNKFTDTEKEKVDGDVREALFEMEKYPLIKAEAILGMDPALMIKATLVSTESDAFNVFSWLCNFTPYDLIKEEYHKSAEVPILDIIVIAFNEWTSKDPFYDCNGTPMLALVNEKQNVLINLGMRYFGERKKGTLTFGWTSGIKLGYAACHGGIKEVDFSTCVEPNYQKLGKRSIVFFGLSGTGKSSHTNSHTNGGTLPQGFRKVILHDDAFQIDVQNKICLGWEPTLFDKTDGREYGNNDWQYMISLMNHLVLNTQGKLMPIGEDVRESNGRALISRELLGKTVNRCSFPKALVWLMKDSVLPPIIKFKNNYLAVAMGAALMTERNKAENIPKEELGKLIFEPFANPFRVYELHKDVEAFLKVADTDAVFYSFNSKGYWRSSDTDLEKISLQTSLTLQTAVLTDALEWEDWDLLHGAMIPTKASVDKIIPDYSSKYDPQKRINLSEYRMTLHDRLHQRINFLKSTDISVKLDLLNKLVDALFGNSPE